MPTYVPVIQILWFAHTASESCWSSLAQQAAYDTQRASDLTHNHYTEHDWPHAQWRDAKTLPISSHMSRSAFQCIHWNMRTYSSIFALS